MKKTADTLPKFQTDYMFIRTVAEKNSAMYYFLAKRSGVVISFMSARKGGFEDLTEEILRHFEAYGFFNPVIYQCDREMSVFDMFRKVARERNARAVLRFFVKTSHQLKGFVEAVHGHIQGLPRCYQTQIKTNTDVQFSAISRTIPFSVRALDLFSQDSQCDPTAEPVPIFAWIFMCITFVHVQWIGNRCDSRTDGSVVVGGDEMHRLTNTW